MFTQPQEIDERMLQCDPDHCADKESQKKFHRSPGLHVKVSKLCYVVFGLDIGFGCLDFTITTPTKMRTNERSAAPASPGMMIAYSRSGK